MTRPRIDDAMLARIMADARATRRIPAEAHDRPSAGEGWYILLGTAAALGWIAGLVAWGII